MIHDMKRFFLTLWLSWLPLMSLASERPNILVFLVDDLGYMDIGVSGSTFYETPAIDGFAAEGMRFINAYAAHPRCVPSRYGFFTGKYPAREGVPGNSYNIDPDETTIAEALQEEGYRTFFAGKWHLAKSPEQMPDAQGFEINIAGGKAGAPNSYFAPYNQSKRPGHKGNELAGLDDAPEGEYLNDRLTDETIQFLNQYAEKTEDQPFFAVLAHYAVHTPLEAKEEDIQQFQAKLSDDGDEKFLERDGATKAEQDNPIYAAMIKNTDESLGRVMETLKRLKLDDGTVVIVTSDHGGLSNRGANNQRPLATSNLPLRAGKGHLYEGGIRVPFIVRWPGKISAGVVTDSVINGSDVYPTLLAIADAPMRPEQHVDGVSFADALQGKEHVRAPIIWHSPRPRPNGTGDEASSAIRDGNYKLIKFYFPDVHYELYDLSSDPGESHDLAEEQPKLRDELATKLDVALTEMNAIEVKQGRR